MHFVFDYHLRHAKVEIFIYDLCYTVIAMRNCMALVTEDNERRHQWVKRCFSHYNMSPPKNSRCLFLLSIPSLLSHLQGGASASHSN